MGPKKSTPFSNLKTFNSPIENGGDDNIVYIL